MFENGGERVVMKRPVDQYQKMEGPFQGVTINKSEYGGGHVAPCYAGKLLHSVRHNYHPTNRYVYVTDKVSATSWRNPGRKMFRLDTNFSTRLLKRRTVDI